VWAGARRRLCHSPSTSSCPRCPLTTLSARQKDHAVRIKASWAALSVVVLSVGLLLVASLDDSPFIKGQQSVAPARSAPPGTRVSAEATAPSLTTPTPSSAPPAPTAGMPTTRPAAMPSGHPHRHQPRPQPHLLRLRKPHRRRQRLPRRHLGEHRRRQSSSRHYHRPRRRSAIPAFLSGAPH
jgi:hypothetical protein